MEKEIGITRYGDYVIRFNEKWFKVTGENVSDEDVIIPEYHIPDCIEKLLSEIRKDKGREKELLDELDRINTRKCMHEEQYNNIMMIISHDKFIELFKMTLSENIRAIMKAFNIRIELNCNNESILVLERCSFVEKDESNGCLHDSPFDFEIGKIMEYAFDLQSDEFVENLKNLDYFEENNGWYIHERYKIKIGRRTALRAVEIAKGITMEW